jgi:hypothetical protein
MEHTADEAVLTEKKSKHLSLHVLTAKFIRIMVLLLTALITIIRLLQSYVECVSTIQCGRFFCRWMLMHVPPKSQKTH